MRQWQQTLHTQRWDDHRYYHHSYVNQSLHFISAVSFWWLMFFFSLTRLSPLLWLGWFP